MKAKMLLSSIAIALGGLVGSGAHAVTVTDTYYVPTSPFAIVTGPSANPTYYEFVASNSTDTSILLEGAHPGIASDVTYNIWTDTDLDTGVVSFDESNPLFTTTGNAGANPDFFFTFLMEIGKQYVLSIQNASAFNTTQTNVSAVPLPGALWLFGSALLGFLGFSSRRKA